MNADYLRQCIDHEQQYTDTVTQSMLGLNPVEHHETYCAEVRASNKTKPAFYRKSVLSFADFRAWICESLTADRALAQRRLRKLTLQLEKLEQP